MRQFKKYKKGCTILGILCMCLLSRGTEAAVTNEELGNPVRDAESHRYSGMTFDTVRFHKTRFNHVYFGSYPQKEIKGSEITDAIRNGAYDANGDAVIDGKKYRRLTWEMKTTTGNFNETPKSYWMKTSDNGYRYFLYEPIKWRILQNEGDVLFLMSDNILDQQPMDAYTAYTKSWETYHLRTWLNYDGTTEWTLPKQYKIKGFYRFAFDKEEQQRIQTTHVVQDINPYYTDDKGNPLDSGPDTEDKIFLLSNTEITAEQYGFCSSEFEKTNNTKRTECFAAAVGYTAYACALGPEDMDSSLYPISACWLRTCGYKKAACMAFTNDGYAIGPYGYLVNAEYIGVVPALKADFRLSDCHKITFETNGAGTVEPQILLGSNYAMEPEPLTKKGYLFTGWYTDPGCQVPYLFNRKLSEDTTLYAGWITPKEQEIREEMETYEKEHGIAPDTVTVTDETIKAVADEGDVKGSSYRLLQARAAKTKKNSITLKWKKVKEADGYEIYGNRCGKKNRYTLIKTVKQAKTTEFTHKKLKKGTYYKYIVRAYKTIGGKKVTLTVSKTVHAATAGGRYGNAKSVKVKKSSVTLKKGKTYGLKGKEVKKSLPVKKHRKVAYESGNPDIATVSAKGVIRAKKKGSCTIYAYAQNGVYKKIKVKVKQKE